MTQWAVLEGLDPSSREQVLAMARRRRFRKREVGFHEGRMYVGMMPGSTKFQDVERDPRISLVTAIADKDDMGDPVPPAKSKRGDTDW